MSGARGEEGGARLSAASQKRRRDILLAGKKVFFREGYQLASVDRIAEEAGTTKRTVYDRFGSKEALFSEVIAFAGAQFVTLLPSAAELPADPAQGLKAFTAKLRDLLASSDIVRFQRLVIAEAERQPALGRALHETALGGIERILSDYLRARVVDGRLLDHDTEETARLIVDVAINSLRLRTLLGLETGEQDRLGKRLIERTIASVVKDYAPRK